MSVDQEVYIGPVITIKDKLIIRESLSCPDGKQCPYDHPCYNENFCNQCGHKGRPKILKDQIPEKYSYELTENFFYEVLRQEKGEFVYIILLPNIGDFGFRLSKRQSDVFSVKNIPDQVEAVKIYFKDQLQKLNELFEVTIETSVVTYWN